MTTGFLQLAHHSATGVVLSDTALRFVTLKQRGDSVVPETFAELALPVGMLSNGTIANKSGFVTFLKNARTTYDLKNIQLVLNSSQIQTFSVSAVGPAAPYVKEALEKNLGLPLKSIAYDNDAIAAKNDKVTYHVTGMSKALSQDMVSAFKSAGMTLQTIESVGHALSRALIDPLARENALIVNIDSALTSLTFVTAGVVAYTTLFDFGDAHITKSLVEGLGISEEEAFKMKREEGLVGHHSKRVFDVLSNDAAALVRHINDMYIAWKTEHDTLPPLEGVYLTGTGSTLKGLADYLSVGLHLPVQEGNVWVNCLWFDDYIPALPQTSAAGYGPAIGVSLQSDDAVNMLPHEHKKTLQRQRVARISGRIFLSFVFGVAVGFVVAKIIANPAIHTRMMDVLHKTEARW